MAVKAPGKVMPQRLIRSAGGRAPEQRTSHENPGPRSLLPLDITLSGEQARPVPLGPTCPEHSLDFSPQLSHQAQKEKTADVSSFFPSHYHALTTSKTPED